MPSPTEMAQPWGQASRRDVARLAGSAPGIEKPASGTLIDPAP
ncbi:hypothetical protein [Methylobacterium sp. Leaf399]|nr:hypothetical protein [Methylobacterium sp. Leaf399]